MKAEVAEERRAVQGAAMRFPLDVSVMSVLVRRYGQTPGLTPGEG